MIVLLICKLNYMIRLACHTSDKKFATKPQQETENINLN